jgi:hypothetical protein
MTNSTNGVTGAAQARVEYGLPWAGPLPPPESYDPMQILREAFDASHPMLQAATTVEKMFPHDQQADLVSIPRAHLSEEEFRRFARGLMADKASKAIASVFEAEQRRAANLLMGVYQDVSDRLGLGPLDKLAPESCPVIDTQTGCVFQRPEPKEEKTKVRGLAAVH